MPPLLSSTRPVLLLQAEKLPHPSGRSSPCFLLCQVWLLPSIDDILYAPFDRSDRIVMLGGVVLPPFKGVDVHGGGVVTASKGMGKASAVLDIALSASSEESLTGQA